ncbi:MAG: substrate-binding domain-containing protein [Burkholderiales bacterium]
MNSHSNFAAWFAHRLQTVGAALLLAIAFNASAQTYRVGGTGSALGTLRLVVDALAAKDARQVGISIVPNLGSSGSLRALQAGAIEVALVSRELTQEEKNSGLVGFEYGRSPFVFLTNKPGVKGVTNSLVAQVLRGSTLVWPDGQPVRFVTRPESDGDNAYIAQFSADIAAALKVAHKRPGMVMAATDQEAADEAERLPGSLATNTLALVKSERRKLTVLDFNGHTPSSHALAAGSYMHFKRFLIVTKGAPQGEARRLIDFIKSTPGRVILEANGHVVAK